MSKNNKSLLLTYIFWLFGGVFGLHHFYLRRDKHAFVWLTTFGGYVVGWLSEILSIPRYVREANEEPSQMEKLIKAMKQYEKPPFTMDHFALMTCVSYSWAQLLMMAVPPDEILGYNFRFLNHFVPFAAALGVWTVGNIGYRRGGIKWPLLAAYAAYFLKYYINDDIWFVVMVLAASLAFDTYGKQWKRTPDKKHGLARRIAVLGVCACLYTSLWCGYIYYNNTITDSDGEEVPVHEALYHFFTSPWWLDLKQSLYDIYTMAQHHGWYEIWKQIIELSDPHGEQHAYKVLSLTPEATQQQITATWRRLSKENHPDKVKDPALARAAQERFMEIQQAYEILSKLKHRRKRRNKKDNSETTDFTAQT